MGTRGGGKLGKRRDVLRGCGEVEKYREAKEPVTTIKYGISLRDTKHKGDKASEMEFEYNTCAALHMALSTQNNSKAHDTCISLVFRAKFTYRNSVLLNSKEKIRHMDLKNQSEEQLLIPKMS
ncbi:unnamed protein product [Arabis nemorensis]|uniref:Uncharacterized protein n=1 Tax=Arabis nemorensis TaxID=586526 RepID=A0A565BTD2_9BRAS|nr:unnamed protein product [Arabis nemorensis]